MTLKLIFLLLTLTVLTANTSTVPSGNCDSDGLYSDPNDCSAYTFCKNGLQYRLSCGSGKIFDANDGNCVEEGKTKCKNGQTVYFPNNFGEAKKMMQQKFNPNNPKVVCYISNWNKCTASSDHPLVPTQLVCNQACYATAALTKTPESLKTACPSIKLAPKKNSFKLFCYFTNWAWYRSGVGTFLPEDIEPSLCTHINYAYAVFDNATLTIKPLDTWADLDNDFYQKIVSLKSTGVKVIISFGGWSDSADNKFTRMVSTPASRKNFIDSVLNFINQWGFDGMELDWDYPKCWQSKCGKTEGNGDKVNFVALVKELSEAFKPKGLLLGSTIAHEILILDSGYDLPALSKYLDWGNVLAYNFRGHWQKKTGHASLLYGSGNLNINSSISYIINKGFEPSKLILGMSAYGASFKLENPNNHGVEDRVSGPGTAGEISTNEGSLAFYEICDRIKRKQWTVVRDANGKNTPYTYKDDQWVSYNDVTDMQNKAKYIKENNLGGAMFWTLGIDDFKNSCGCGKFPLLNALSTELRDVSLNSKLENCT